MTSGNSNHRMPDCALVPSKLSSDITPTRSSPVSSSYVNLGGTSVSLRKDSVSNLDGGACGTEEFQHVLNRDAARRGHIVRQPVRPNKQEPSSQPHLEQLTQRTSNLTALSGIDLQYR